MHVNHFTQELVGRKHECLKCEEFFVDKFELNTLKMCNQIIAPLKKFAKQTIQPMIKYIYDIGLIKRLTIDIE